jgi:hypothetical protein
LPSSFPGLHMVIVLDVRHRPAAQSRSSGRAHLAAPVDLSCR